MRLIVLDTNALIQALPSRSQYHRIQYIKGITFQYAFCTQRAIDKLIKK